MTPSIELLVESRRFANNRIISGLPTSELVFSFRKTWSSAILGRPSCCTSGIGWARVS